MTPDTVREEVFHQLGETVVSRKMDFRTGYFSRNVVIWINDQDSEDARERLKKFGRLTLWCIGIPPEKRCSKWGCSTDRTESGSGDDSTSASRKMRCGHTEQQSARAKELK